MNVIRAIFDFKFYNEIHKNKVRKSLLYVFLFSLLVYYIGVFAAVGKFNKLLKTEVTTFINNLPEFKMENGILDVYAEHPLEFKTDNRVFVVDTNGKTNINDYKNYKSIVFIGDKGIVSKNGVYWIEYLLGGKRQQINTYKYKNFIGNILLKSFDKKHVLTVFNFFKGAIVRYIFLFYILWYIVWLPLYKVWSILLLSLIALFIDHIQKSGLTYKSLFNISVYALTLPWFIKVIYKAFNIDNYISGFIFFFIYWGIASIYVSRAVKEIKKVQNLEADEPEESVLKEANKVEETNGFQQIDEFTIE